MPTIRQVGHHYSQPADPSDAGPSGSSRRAITLSAFDVSRFGEVGAERRLGGTWRDLRRSTSEANAAQAFGPSASGSRPGARAG